ncbi:DUF397 domain-containing protein [Actinomadura luteofluorescens]|uniref:DUF397 domain-containing protein n=1 Tax=Actinomadura luteofluorescens TaxID=46163 RepID=A0A7Y9EP28_9ACTN|nr:DUF397 domain-containing protein [Actinomadura luteofluorescens]NYD51328.1 hypothetical protein [Actinomadura luteofluorescens]
MSMHYFAWHKSSHSNPDGHCVEVGQAADGTVGVRDTKLDDNGPILEFTADEWRTLLNKIRSRGR